MIDSMFLTDLSMPRDIVRLTYLFGYKTFFFFSSMTTISRSFLRNFAKVCVLSISNNSKDLDPSDKTDLAFWDCFGRKTLRLITKEIR